MATRQRRRAARAHRDDVELVKMAVLARRSGVSTPTIKHYIREGLLPGPAVRTSRNMAYYDARNVDRLRTIRQLQAEQFLPLRVIAELLEPPPSARLRASAAAQRRALTALVPAVQPAPGVQRRKRTEVMRTEGVTAAELAQLERAGIIALRGSGDTAGYAGPDLALLELLGEVRRAGLGDVFPIAIATEYLAAVRALVAAEVDVFRRHALAGTPPAPLPELARQAVGYGERLVVALRAKLIPEVLAGNSGSRRRHR